MCIKFNCPEYISVDTGIEQYELVGWSIYEDYTKNELEVSGHIYKRGRKPEPRIKKVIFNYPATIVLWNDGTKTVVKDERAGTVYAKALFTEFTKKDIEGAHAWREAGLLNAICKKAYGNGYIDEVRKWCG